MSTLGNRRLILSMQKLGEKPMSEEKTDLYPYARMPQPGFLPGLAVLDDNIATARIVGHTLEIYPDRDTTHTEIGLCPYWDCDGNVIRTRVTVVNIIHGSQEPLTIDSCDRCKRQIHRFRRPSEDEIVEAAAMLGRVTCPKCKNDDSKRHACTFCGGAGSVIPERASIAV